MGNFVKVAHRGEIPVGQGKCVEVEGKRIAIFNVNGAYYAIDGICPHQGGPLGEGELDGTVVTCPWHGWEFDVTTGVNRDDSDIQQQQFAVKVDGDDILVEV
ncbi:MAG: Rieske 2Fe-2S domain-containing protein [Candidatus Binatia bacterium]|nr:Rieske 2Fe-2S domain-containing protein [Candidatus Binatia bacterium]